jgi:DMSO/TMAO reductase YedYZ molybdopterin-dependent catalytic subunit
MESTMTTDKITSSGGQKPLPPHQKEFPSFDRFGLGFFAYRFPQEPESLRISISGDVATPFTLDGQLDELERVEQCSDFHCVTTWSVRNQHWSGVRFRDFYQQVVEPLAKPEKDATFVVFRGQDTYACSMQLQDLMADDVLLVDTHNDEKLGLEHGAPLRLICPAHYGYKNVKHIKAIEFWRDRRNYRFPLPYPNLMDHPRGRVAYEERARFLPNWLIRPLYKALMPLARKKQAKAAKAYYANNKK